VAGIRMIPVVEGKYKVWTRRIGSGPIQVLLHARLPGSNGIVSATSRNRDLLLTINWASEIPISRMTRLSGRSLAASPNLKRCARVWDSIILCFTAIRVAACWRLNTRSIYQQQLRGLVISNMTAGIQS